MAIDKNIGGKIFDDAIKALAKKFGTGYDKRGLNNEVYKAIPTGHDDLDCLLTKGARGIYLGGIIEVLGGEGGGKSSIAMRTVGEAQKASHKCCWIDAESGFDNTLAMINGCDPTMLVMPDLADTRVMAEDGVNFFNSTEVLEMIYQSIISNVFGLIVLDSVAGLMPERILQDDFDPNKVGVSEVARSMAQMLGKIAAACKKTETSVIFINQLRDKPGEYFHDRFHTPGGRALKFFAQQRLSVEKMRGKDGRVINKDGDKEEVIGHYARITIVKNKKAPPVPEGMAIEVPIYYREYFPDIAKKCYDLARQLQVIRVRNGVMTWKNDKDDIIFQIEGESSVLQHIRDMKLESQLAAACVMVADSSDKAKKAVVSQPIRDLASQFVPETKDVKQTKQKKNTVENSLSI